MSPCDYAQPVVSEITLYDITKKKKGEYLTPWHDGGVAWPGYQGFINGFGFDISNEYLEVGNNYKLVYRFRDPKFDFERFKNRIKRKFGYIEQQIPNLSRSSINPIPHINEILGIRNMPEIREIIGIDFANGSFNGLASSARLLKEYLGYKVWPPYFESVCNPSLSTCEELKDELIDIVVHFKLGAKDEGGNFTITDTKFDRKSYILKNVSNIRDLPELKCGYDL
jgi:hypothetical protein